MLDPPEGKIFTQKEFEEVLDIANFHLDKLHDYSIMLRTNMYRFKRHIKKDELREKMCVFFARYCSLRNLELDPAEKKFALEIQEWEDKQGE